MKQEDLKVIFDRAIQYILAKYNEECISIEIEIDGTLSAKYLKRRGCCGDPDEYSHHYFNIYDLTSDLDALVIERKEKEKIEAENKESMKKNRKNLEKVGKRKKKS